MFRKLGHIIAGCIRKMYFLFPSDAFYLQLVYFFEMGHWIDYKHPKRFTEKLQWLKIYDRKLEYVQMVDKITAKEYVARKIGQQYVIPTLGVWNHFNEIDFESLPPQFVLKTNHGSGSNGVVICRDKKNFDFAKAEKLLESGLKGNTYNKYREWPYKNIQPKIFAEQLLCEEPKALKNATDLTDYKFFCFNGEAKVFKVDINRFGGHYANYYDCQGRLLPFGEAAFPPKPESDISLPQNLSEMIDIANQLSQGLSFLRVDLYNVGERIYFSELTFYPASGFGRFTNDDWDKELGSYLKMIDKARCKI